MDVPMQPLWGWGRLVVKMNKPEHIPPSRDAISTGGQTRVGGTFLLKFMSKIVKSETNWFVFLILALLANLGSISSLFPSRANASWYRTADIDKVTAEKRCEVRDLEWEISLFISPRRPSRKVSFHCILCISVLLFHVFHVSYLAQLLYLLHV